MAFTRREVTELGKLLLGGGIVGFFGIGLIVIILQKIVGSSTWWETPIRLVGIITVIAAAIGLLILVVMFLIGGANALKYERK